MSFATCLACSHADTAGDLESLGSENDFHLGEASNGSLKSIARLRPRAGQSYEAEEQSGNLTRATPRPGVAPARRNRLYVRVQQLIPSLGAAPQRIEGKDERPSRQSEQATLDAKPLEVGVSNHEKSEDSESSASSERLTHGSEDATGTTDNGVPRIKELWERFLASAHETPAGGFLVEDVLLPSEDSLVEYFAMLHSDYVDKGLVVPNKAWPKEGCTPFCLDPAHVEICWTPDSDATNGDKAFVADLVQATWAGSAEVDFDFKDGSGNWRTCGQEACGFFNCFTGNADIALFQTSGLPSGGVAGCSRLGTEHLDPSNPPHTCGVSHDYATMMLPIGDVYGRTVIHEFGHAIGLLHEHLRDENTGTCTAIVNSRNNELPLLVGQGCTGPGCYAESPVGDYDPLSVMHYCTDALALFTVGDISSSQTLYDARQYEVRFQHSSWYSAQVALTLSGSGLGGGPWTVNASQSPVAFATGENAFVGGSYAASAVPVSDGRLHCYATRPFHPNVRDGQPIVPPGGFQTRPVLVGCYDPAVLSAILL